MFPRTYYAATYYTPTYYPGPSTHVLIVMPLGVLSGGRIIDPVYP